LRQTTYSTARFALYDILARNVQRRNGGGKLSAGSTIACAGLAGGLAGMIGNPTEVAKRGLDIGARLTVNLQVVLVRMCADGVKPPAQKYVYSNAIGGLIRIGRDEGLKTFTKGLGPNVVRSILMSESSTFHCLNVD
jgi:dicarboxylate transporter 10